ncbi:predicted protein [Streptomyces sp. SPB78]|nr:predicted protein [Streptomyces sp. SPB78]
MRGRAVLRVRVPVLLPTRSGYRRSAGRSGFFSLDDGRRRGLRGRSPARRRGAPRRTGAQGGRVA